MKMLKAFVQRKAIVTHIAGRMSHPLKSSMKLLFLFCFLSFSLMACNKAEHKQKEHAMDNPLITIKTNLGDIQLELFAEQAPQTVKNFLLYVDEKHYNKTIFHRVINDFMIQGGGYSAEFKEKTTHPPIRNEADNKIANKRGTIAMARTSEIHSATAQFFINVSDNDFLNFKSPSPSGFGYCVFGQVVKGMDIVDQIKKVNTGSRNGHRDVPMQTIEILEIVRN